jgi:tRNA(Ile2) C34 agmatinyltransferase TiaS
MNPRCPSCNHGTENLGDGEYRCLECGTMFEKVRP